MSHEDYEMNPREAEIAKAIAHVIEPDREVEPARVVIQEFDGGRAEIVVVKMYEYVDFDIQTLERVASLLGTDRINIGDKSSSRGCSSCDYGSRYEVDLEVFGIVWPRVLPKHACPDCGALHEYDPCEKHDGPGYLSCDCGYNRIDGELYAGKELTDADDKAKADARRLLGLDPSEAT